MLESQLHDQRLVVKDAITASQKIENLVRGEVRSSINLEVANEALNLAKRQLDVYNKQDSLHVSPHPAFTAPNNPSQFTSPQRVPSPPPAPFVPQAPSSPLHPDISTGVAGRRRSKSSSSTTPSVVYIPSGRNQPRNSRTRRRRPGVPPTAKDVAIDVGHPSARAFPPRGERGGPVRDANEDIVRKEHHQGDDEGL